MWSRNGIVFVFCISVGVLGACNCTLASGFCGLEVQQQNKLYRFNLASPLKDHPHGALSEDGFYKVMHYDSENEMEIKIWFQVCEQMVFNHDLPKCFRCLACERQLHCGLTCNALMARNIDGYEICTSLGHTKSINMSLIDMKNPSKGIELNMHSLSTQGTCSLSISLHCNKKFQAPLWANSTGECKYVTNMMHPAGCPVVTSFGGKGWGWLGSLFTMIICFFTAYFLLGILYRFFVLQIRGIEVIPNLEFWSSVPRRILNLRH